MAFIAVAVIPPIISFTILLLRYADIQRDQAERELIESANGIARTVDTVFTAAIAALDTMKTSALLNRDDLTAFETRLRRATFETGRAFAFIDASGQNVITSSVQWRHRDHRSHRKSSAASSRQEIARRQ